MVFREGLSETFGTVPIAGARIEVKPGGRIRRLLLVLRKLTTMTMPMMNGVTSKSKRIKKSTSSADDCGGFSAVSDGTTLSSSATTTTKLLADDERLLHQQWKNCGDLRFYTVALFFVTQTSYCCVAASLLATTFFEPTKDFCRTARLENRRPWRGSRRPDWMVPFNGTATNGIVSTSENISLPQFHSLLFDWGLACDAAGHRATLAVSTALMGGAIMGAFLAGFCADQFGRKPTTVASLALVGLGNFGLTFFAALNPWTAIGLFTLIGAASGGYMVVNMVLLMESLERGRSRLVAVSCNGWAPAMVFSAGLAWATADWWRYHIAVGVMAVVMVGALNGLALETRPRHPPLRRPAIQLKKKQQPLLLSNGNHSSCSPALSTSSSTPANSSISVPISELNPKNFIDVDNEEIGSIQESHLHPNERRYTYADLVRYTAVRRPLFALLACFGATSAVSFGLYFATDALPGPRHSHLALMGLGKTALGFVPLAVSPWGVGRRTIVLASVGMAACACWALVVGWLLFGLQAHWLATALGLAVIAAIDPTWKVAHLLSVELFPTPVRNMARASCNVVARLGSLTAPLVVWLRAHDPLAPFWLFAFLLTAEWLAVFVGLPETRGRPLPEHMPPPPLSSSSSARNGRKR